jgi:hypothetical protein
MVSHYFALIIPTLSGAYVVNQSSPLLSRIISVRGQRCHQAHFTCYLYMDLFRLFRLFPPAVRPEAAEKERLS